MVQLTSLVELTSLGSLGSMLEMAQPAQLPKAPRVRRFQHPWSRVKAAHLGVANGVLVTERCEGVMPPRPRGRRRVTPAGTPRVGFRSQKARRASREIVLPDLL